MGRRAIPIRQPASPPTAVVDSRTAVLEYAGNEFFFAVVGHVGAGTSTVARALEALLTDDSLPGGPFDVTILKARDEITEWATKTGRTLPTTPATDVDTTSALQDLGDLMRQTSSDNSAVAKALISRVRLTRAAKIGVSPEDDAPVRPDGTRRAYVLDSVRHPSEVELLRHVYQDAFLLVGIVCEEDERLRRLNKKYFNAGNDRAKNLMNRDAKAQERHGQRVSDTFHLSDFFIDNTVRRFLDEDDGESNPAWDVNDRLSRLIKILTHREIVRPEASETAMHHAQSAGMRSACLSRQVGAALIDWSGNLISTGTNEVPRAGGGVYGESALAHEAEQPESYDHRCAYRSHGGMGPHCSNTRQQNLLVDRLIDDVAELKAADANRKGQLSDEIRKSGVGDLLEFSRAVHAEMDAILSAGRQGASAVGTRLFVTTFPCHYCARHIVSAGIDEVQYVEPYPKSRALSLHQDAIQVNGTNWKPPSKGGRKVLFRPFSGVAPRMYRRAFLKDRDLKDARGALAIGTPDWGTAWHIRSAGYVELEAALTKSEA